MESTTFCQQRRSFEGDKRMTYQELPRCKKRKYSCYGTDQRGLTIGRNYRNNESKEKELAPKHKCNVRHQISRTHKNVTLAIDHGLS